MHRVDHFSASDGKWSDVRANLTSAGNAVDPVTRQEKQEQLKRDDVCGNLAKEERNPMVEEAMRKLRPRARRGSRACTRR